MRNEQNAVLASLRRVQQFLDASGDAVAAVNNSTRKQLDDVVTQLSDLSITQEASTRGSKGETARRHAALATLRRGHMAPIAELAKLTLREVPEFAALTLPSSNSTAQRLIASAYAMADAATPHSRVLIDNGMPPTFADDLRTAAAAVADAIAERTAFHGRRVGATAGLAAAERRGRTILRVLNALVMVRIGNDARLIAEWSSAKLVRRKPGPVAGRQSVDVTTRVTTLVPTVVQSVPSSVTPAVAVAA